MKKQKAFVYRCSACGHEEQKWLGRCPECGEWNTLAETAVSPVVKRGMPSQGRRGEPNPESIPLAAVDPQEGKRVPSGIDELDRVLGGGIMKRSCILVGGEPGIGKSTLLLQAAALAGTKGRVLYVSGEESAGQIRMRGDRLGLDAGAQQRIEVLCSGCIEDIERSIEKTRPLVIIIDSVQTLYSAEAGLSPGALNQMRFCAWELISWVKEHDAALFLVAHVTKDGLIAGPKALEHMVDTVLYFEGNFSAAGGDCRFLRAVKNRFGSVDEIGIFTMGEKGLAPVEDPSLLFLVRREGELPPGVATAAVLEGSRTLLVEIQALTSPAKGSMSRVFSDRIDSARVSRVAAAIEKHLALRLSDQDLYINAAGGIKISEVGAELALAAAIYSARTGLSLPAKTCIAGDLSLTGEVRPIRRLPVRVRTAANLGYDSFVGPLPDSAEALPGRFTGVKNIGEAIKALFGPAPPAARHSPS
ncbi:MAG: DNA repair protein RadA [Treponema sp.]|jgi:DNA repair protein RadA/Sms|nr:DNA repair protein RadA [Treponema sp.]